MILDLMNTKAVIPIKEVGGESEKFLQTIPTLAYW